MWSENWCILCSQLTAVLLLYLLLALTASFAFHKGSYLNAPECIIYICICCIYIDVFNNCMVFQFGVVKNKPHINQNIICFCVARVKVHFTCKMSFTR